MIRILVIEDDRAIRLSLEEDLATEGYDVELASDGASGLAIAMRGEHHLILLDLMLPGMSGLDVCRELRRKGIRTAIIMLTARSQDMDKVIGLELGADDYITKPFNSHELRSRIRAVLRRTLPEPPVTAGVIRLEPFEIDPVRYEFRLRGELIGLTQLEFDLLAILMKHPGAVLKRNDILNEVWGNDVFVTPRTIDAHIAKMRRKFRNPADRERIVCLRGVGYKFLENG